jgi:hypothetical protein
MINPKGESMVSQNNSESTSDIEANNLHQDEAKSGTSRCRLTVLASLSVLLISAAVVMWMPSTEEMALEKARQLLAEGNPTDALIIADKVLTAQPDSQELKEIAIAAARAQLDTLVARSDIKGAVGWLYRQMDAKPYLEPLRGEIMLLDARDTVKTVLTVQHYADEHRPEPLQRFLSRYADNADAPYYADTLLEENKWPQRTRLWLIGTALERGHAADDKIYRFLISQLEEGPVDSGMRETVRELLRQHYPEQSQAWAEAALDGGHVMAFMNGWAMLKENDSPRLEDAYYQGLNRLSDTSDVRSLEQSRAILSMQTNSARRLQVIAFLSELVDTYPKFINSPQLKDEILRLRDGLQQSWAL